MLTFRLSKGSGDAGRATQLESVVPVEGWEGKSLQMLLGGGPCAECRMNGS